MDTNDFAQKSTKKFECFFCDFYTSNKNHYNRHLETEKHKQRSILIDTNDLRKKSTIFECECGKSYKHKPSLYNHKKKCDYKENQLSVLQEKEKEKEKEIENINYKEIINQLINQNNLLQNTIKDLIPKIGNNNITNNTINNTTNQNLNVNLFLNEKCKDAIDIDEFVNAIEVSVDDLLFIKDKGIVKGLANIINNNLIDLPLDKRPIWCSDKKHKKIFVKKELWEEDIDNIKTKQAIHNVTRIQSKNISKYQITYPNFMTNDKEREKFIQMVSKNTESIKDKENNIINNIIDTIYLGQNVKNIIT